MEKSGIGTRLGRRGLIWALAIALVGSVALTTRRDLAAQDDESGRVCSNVTLHGDYGYLVSGFKPVPPPLGGGLERFNAAGVFAFDGNGTFTFEGGALQGEITGTNPDPSNVVGTYEVNPNCTGTMSWQPNLAVPVFIRFAIVVVDNAKQVKLAGTTGLSQGDAIRK
jgi:hypothetical protein